MNFQLHLVVQMSNPKASVSPKPLLTQLEPWLHWAVPGVASISQSGEMLEMCRNILTTKKSVHNLSYMCRLPAAPSSDWWLFIGLPVLSEVSCRLAHKDSLASLLPSDVGSPNGRQSNGPSSIWTVHWTAYITVIWTVQNYRCGP